MSTLSVVALICMVPLYGYVAAWPVRHYSVGADRFLFFSKVIHAKQSQRLFAHPSFPRAS